MITNSYQLNGTTQSILLGDYLDGYIAQPLTGPPTNRKFTLSWVGYFQRTGAIEDLISKWSATGNQRAFILRRNATGNLQFLFSWNGTNTMTLTTTEVFNRIGDFDVSCVTVVVDQTQTTYNNIFKIYYNGILFSHGNNSTATNKTIFNSTAPLRFGVTDGSAGLNFFFKGIINKVDFWGTNLSAADVLDHFNSGQPKSYSLYSTPIESWGFDNDTWGTDWTIVSSSGTRNGTSLNLLSSDQISVTPYNVPAQFIMSLVACSHVLKDYQHVPSRNSLSEAKLEIESLANGCNPNCMVHIGDASSTGCHMHVTNDATEGAMFVSQASTGTLPLKEIYTAPGNTDAGDLNMDWFLRYMNPYGVASVYNATDNAARSMPVTPLTNGNGYTFENGNLLFIVLFDINDGDAPYGCHGEVPGEGCPSGMHTIEQFNAVTAIIDSNLLLDDSEKKNIFILNHHGLPNTVIGTGDYDGVNAGFNSSSSGVVIGNGRLETIKNGSTYESTQTRWQDYFALNEDCIVAWFSAHEHYAVNQTYNGLGWYNVVSGIAHVSIGALSRWHGATVSINPQCVDVRWTVGSGTMKVYKRHIGGFYSKGMDSSNVLEIPMVNSYAP